MTLLSASACHDERPPLTLRPVVAEALRAAESALPPAESAPASDPEVASRVRGRVEAVAQESGSLRPLLAASAAEFGLAGVPLLARMLGEADLPPRMRMAAAEMLAVLDRPESARVLAFHAGSNPESWVRAQCAWRLESTSQDQVVPDLIAAIATERDPEAHSYLARTLARFGCPGYGVEITAEPVPSPRFQLAIWKAIDGLRSPHERERAIAVLGALPTHAARPLADALSDVELAVRSGAARALSRMGPRAGSAGTALLQSLLADPSIEAEAIEALGAVHHVAGLPAISERLADGERPLHVRIQAARALGRLGGPHAADALRAAHDVREPLELRLAAAGGLCRLGRAEEGFDTLVDALTGPAGARALLELEPWFRELEGAGHDAARRLLASRGRPLAASAELVRELRAARADFVR